MTLLIYLLTEKKSPLHDIKRAAFLGTVFGLALLTKFDAIIILPLLLLRILHKQKNIAFYKNLLIFLTFLIISGGWWYILNLSNYDWFWNKNLFSASLKEYVLPFTFDYYLLNTIALTVITFFATFGISNNILIGPEIYGLFFIIIILFPIGLQKSASYLKNDPHLKHIYWGLLLGFLLNILIFSQINFFTAFQAQGRYLFPSLIFISLILILEISHFFRKENYYLIPIILLISGFFLNYWALGCVVSKFYHFSPLPPFLQCTY